MTVNRVEVSIPASRVPSTCPGPSHAPPANLLEVREALRLSPGLRPRERADLISAINSVGRQLANQLKADGDHLARIATDPIALDQALRDLPSRAVGVSSRSMRNTVSRARKGLRIVGVALPDGHGRLPLMAEWVDALSALVLNAQQRCVVNGFASWCSAHGLPPQQVDRETFDRYEAVFWELGKRRRAAKSGRQLYLSLLDTWNSLIAPLPTVQGRRIEVQRKYDWYALEDEDAAPAFLAEVAAWEHFSATADRLDPDAPRRVRRVTARSESNLIKAIAGAFCKASGDDPKQMTGIHVFVNDKALRTVVRFMLDRAPRGADGRRPRRTDNAYAAARLIHKLARYWVGKLGSGTPLDASTLKKLDELAWRLGPTEPAADERKYKRSLSSRKTRGVTSANRTLLRRFLEPELRRQFIELPYRLFAELPHGRRPTKQEALALTPAFALALLASAPVWPGLLANTHCKDNVRDQEVAGRRQLVLTWRDPRSASGRAFEYELSGRMCEVFDRYTAQVRPVLCDETNAFLFPGRGGGARNPAGLSRQIRELCRRQLGVAITGQQVRHVLAAIVLLGPEGATREAQQLAGRFLGHSRIESSEAVSEVIRDFQSGARFDMRHTDERGRSSATRHAKRSVVQQSAG